MQNCLRIDPQRIRNILQRVLKGEGQGKVSLTVLVCDDKYIKKVHGQYLGDKSATDVIAFGMPKTQHKSERHHMGDIVVSAQTAIRQSIYFQNSAFQELDRYAVHGLLHLCGYKDKTKKDYQIMHRVQENYVLNQRG